VETLIKPKHTPGPWKVINIAPNGFRVGTDKRDGHDTCVVQSVFKEANAQLIAKAWLIPELVEALEGMVKLYIPHEELPSAWPDKAREVLAKVRAEG
jgi:hypothetical protein